MPIHYEHLLPQWLVHSISSRHATNAEHSWGDWHISYVCRSRSNSYDALHWLAVIDTFPTCACHEQIWRAASVGSDWHISYVCRSRTDMTCCISGTWLTHFLRVQPRTAMTRCISGPSTVIVAVAPPTHPHTWELEHIPNAVRLAAFFFVTDSKKEQRISLLLLLLLKRAAQA